MFLSVSAVATDIDWQNLTNDDVQKMLAEGADVNAQDNLGQTIFMYHWQDIDILKKFINDSSALDMLIKHASSLKKRDIGDVVKDFQNNPFSYDEQIMKMMYDGLVDEEIIDNYLNIKELYKSYVKSKIGLYDLLKYDSSALDNLKNSMIEDNKKLTNLINKELKRIDHIIKE